MRKFFTIFPCGARHAPKSVRHLHTTHDKGPKRSRPRMDGSLRRDSILLDSLWLSRKTAAGHAALPGRGWFVFYTLSRKILSGRTRKCPLPARFIGTAESSFELKNINLWPSHAYIRFKYFIRHGIARTRAKIHNSDVEKYACLFK
jgi:hypothetical protein